MSKKNQSDNKIAPNLKKLPLTEYYKRLPKADRRPVIISAPKQELVDAIAAATERDPHTVKRWLLGYTQPGSASEKKVIAQMLQSTVEGLFPQAQAQAQAAI